MVGMYPFLKRPPQIASENSLCFAYGLFSRVGLFCNVVNR